MLFFRDGMFVVGPESASAHPGPVSYRKGGPLTVTDANLCLGRLLPDYFPKIFGPNENEALDLCAALDMFDQLTSQINAFAAIDHRSSSSSSSSLMTREQVAMGFVRVANEAMCRPIRALTQAKGHDTARHVLACFGGAGGQHACAIARSLGMKVVLIHRYSGILSAYGMALADVVHEEQEACSKVFSADSFRYIGERLAHRSESCTDNLRRRGFRAQQIHTEPYLHMRYDRTDCAMSCGRSASCGMEEFLQCFTEKYQTEFGFTIDGRDVIVDDIRVRAVAQTGIQKEDIRPKGTGPPQSVAVISWNSLYLFNRSRIY